MKLIIKKVLSTDELDGHELLCADYECAGTRTISAPPLGTVGCEWIEPIEEVAL